MRSLVFTALLALALASFAEPIPEARLREACVNLLRAPLLPAEIQVLLEVSRQATDNPALRGRAMSAYALALLIQGNTHAFERAVQVLRETLPEAAPLITVTSDQAFAACGDCEQRGVRAVICPSCRGLGKCRACSGSGRNNDAPCAACKGQGLCPMCNGKRRMETVCAACKGTGRVFKPSEAIRENYHALLSSIIALCDENAHFAEALREAARETDPARRIERLVALLQAFPHRSDLAEAQNLLAEAVQKQTVQESMRLEQERREREAAERQALFDLRDAPDPIPAIATLRAYFLAHPDAAQCPELSDLMAELVATRNRRRLTRRLTHIALGLFGLCALATCIGPLFSRRRARPTGPLPGLDKIDRSQFIDPLSLTSKESRSRGQAHPTDSTPDQP